MNTLDEWKLLVSANVLIMLLTTKLENYKKLQFYSLNFQSNIFNQFFRGKLDGVIEKVISGNR